MIRSGGAIPTSATWHDHTALTFPGYCANEGQCLMLRLSAFTHGCVMRNMGIAPLWAGTRGVTEVRLPR
jgi:hypothetical protein